MKKIMGLLSLIALMLGIIPLNVDAAETSKSGTIYGTITVNETPWTAETGTTTQVYSITKSGPYVGMTIIPFRNISNIEVKASSEFEIVGNPTKGTDGSVTVILKAKNGTGVNGTKTELLTAVGTGSSDIVSDGCNLSYSPLALNCSTKIENYYFNDEGDMITAEQYSQLCSGVTPPKDEDVQNADTGIAIPYIAVGGGLIAVAGVYLYSKKSNKVYKI